MGEIGIPRLEYLYELTHCDLLMIERGYNARHHHGWEQARLVAYNARFCMGSKDPIPLVTEWIKFPWEREAVTPLSQSEVEEMQAEIDAINAANAGKPSQNF